MDAFWWNNYQNIRNYKSCASYILYIKVPQFGLMVKISILLRVFIISKKSDPKIKAVSQDMTKYGQKAVSEP